MREGGRESEKRYASFLSGIHAGSRTPFGAGQPSSDWFARPSKKLDSIPANLGPRMMTEFFSPWQDTKLQNSSPKPYIDQKTPSAIASLSWARAVAFI